MELDAVLFDLPMDQGWALRSVALEMDSQLAIKRDCKGYVGQEIENLLRLADGKNH